MRVKFKQFIYVLKIWAYRLIKTTGAGFIYQFVDSLKFRRLKRRPPELMWKALPRSPLLRYDAGGAQIGNKLYVFGGFSHEAPYVIGRVDVLELGKDKWIGHFAMPDDMAQSHLSITSDKERYIYVFGGQLGPHCSPATRNCFVLDTRTQTWAPFAKLPEPRYSPSAHLWDGRIHVFGGSKPDRETCATDHWSIAVKDGAAQENAWRVEKPPVPRGGPHRGSILKDNKVYFFGGQEGDVLAAPGDPEYRPDFSLNADIIYPDTYVLEPGAMEFRKLRDMPAAVSHTEFSAVEIGDRVAVLGGQLVRNKEGVCRIADVIQFYDPGDDSWTIAGRLPYCTKTVVAAYYDGYLYFTAGQIQKSRNDPTAGYFDDRLWKAKAGGP